MSVSPSGFRTNVISTYASIFENITIDRHGNPKKIEPTEQQITQYKNWLISYISVTIVSDPYLGTMPARTLIEHEALKTQAIPPFGHMYPKIRRAISVLSREELLTIFNSTFVERLIKSF